MTSSQIPRWPSGATDEYIKARNGLLQAEWALRDQLEAVAAQRRALPLGTLMKDYTFMEAVNPADIDDASTKKITLADLAADGRSLVVYHLMFSPEADSPCAMCATFVDAMDAITTHIQQHASFVIIAKAPVKKLLAFARARGWDKARFLSSEGTTFNKDMNMEDPSWHEGYTGQMPGLSVFRKDGDGIRHCYSQTADFDKDTVRGLGLLNPLWMLFDNLPDGRPDWMPKIKY